VAIADGTLNWSKSSEGFEWQRDGQSYKEGYRPDAKLSYYFSGKVKGKYLIKSSLDTDKTTQNKLFSNIDPDKYYPIYGDNSSVVYDVNSQGKFYLLVECDKSGLVVGNYQTSMDQEGDLKLIKYNRTLYGGKINLETPGRTIYGDAVSRLTAFMANAHQYAGHSEFLATGTSLYYLRHRNIVEGSEQVRLEIRDKNTGTVLYSIPQQENIDYQIKYDEGRILFTKPVLSTISSDTIISTSILEGNPVYIVANYEYNNQDAFPISPEDLDKRSGGVRVSQALGNNLRVGGTYIRERQTDDAYRLYGADATARLGNFTQLTFEAARTFQSTIADYASYTGGLDFVSFTPATRTSDKAQRISLQSSLGEYIGKEKEFLELSGYYQRIGKNFAVADVASEAGTEKYGVELSHRFSAQDKVRVIAEANKIDQDQDNQLADNQLGVKEAHIYTGQWQHTQGKATFTTEFRQKDETDLLAFYDRPLHQRLLAERLDYQLTKDTALFIGQQLTLSGDSNNQTSLGLATKVSADTSLSAQTAFNQTDNSVVLGLSRNLDESNSTYINYSITNSRIDGKSSTTSIGANTRLGQKATLRRERQFVTSDQRGAYLGNLAAVNFQLNPHLGMDFSYQRREESVDPRLINAQPRDSFSATLAYAQPDKLKVNNKFEFRDDTDSTKQFLTYNSAELKLTQDIFLFGEYDYARTTRPDNDTYAKLETRQVGVAFRPVRYDWFNCLFKYTNLVDDRPQDLTNADGGFIEGNSSSDVYSAEFALDLCPRLQLVEKFSYKDAETMSYDSLRIIQTPDELNAWLWINRLNYHLTKKWDASLEFRTLKEKRIYSAEDSIERGYLFEFTRSITSNIAVGAGVNFTNFTDDLTEKKIDSNKGFFLRLQGRY
jgi:hypothetical protein